MFSVNDKKDFNYTGNYHLVYLRAGVYKFECWGASGGDSENAKGGKGSYTSGVISIVSRRKFYLYPGGKGETDGKTPFNGGGCGDLHFGRQFSSGGGGTDVRLKKNDLNSRIMVSGAGGGSLYYPGNYFANGGNAGALVGYPGASSGSKASELVPASPGNQTSAGLTNAGFGYGGSCYAGGGGGYYGGGCGTSIFATISSGAGGSSFVSGFKGCIDPKKKSEFHESNLYFTQSEIKSGSEEIDSPDGNKEIGHTGNGFIRITFIASNIEIPILTHKTCRKLIHFELIILTLIK